MIKDSDGNIFEEMRTLSQDLTFNNTKEIFNHHNIEFNESKFKTLGLENINDNLFTNLALILSDQCQHTIKVAVFGDDENTSFKDAKEFTGSIFNQLENTLSYLALCNRTTFTFKGLERIEKKDYPEEALREALLNSIIHRDYSFSGSTIININDKCIEFISLGGLLPGLTEEDIYNGISLPRNKKLADIFHRLGFIESYGTGIRKILNLYKDCPIQPGLKITPNSFKLILPNMNNAPEYVIQADSKAISEQTSPSYGKSPITRQMKTVLNYLSKNNEISISELESLLDIKQTRAYILTKEMNELGLIEITGRGDNRKYRLS